jgi:outer membrane lipoprotein-sorting protein
MPRAWLIPLCLLAAVACAPPTAPVGAAPATPDTSTWPAPDAALTAASAAMSQLQSLREKFVSRIYRNDQLFLGNDVERAYVAPDRRYERFEGRSPVEVVKGETVTIGPRFFKKVGDDGPWQALPAMESFAWPAQDYMIAGARGATWVGAEQIDGRTALVLVVTHEGSPQQRNEGWQFQTKLWIDPETHYFLKRETRGTRQEPADPTTGQPLVQRYEATWTYLNHNAAISITEPADAVSP